MMSVYQTSKSEPNPPEKGKNAEAKSETQGQQPEQQLIHLRQQIVAIAHRMGQTETIEKLLQVSVDQLQEKLNCDRALVYKFDNKDQGQVLAEAKNRGWTPTEGENLPVTTFGFDSRQEYLDQTLVIVEKKQPQLTPYQQQLLERFQIQSSATVPIIIANNLWGLLSIQQCENSRQWSESEKLLLEQISIQLTLSLQQSEYQKQLQGIEAREQALAGVIEKVRRSLDQETIFKNLTQEVRNFMDADRVGVYRFDENWSGEFIAEAVGANWIKLVGPGIKTVWEDTHLQDTQGGRYRYHEVFAVDDIYQAGHSPCHVEILEQFEVKAYLIVPIFVGEKLWGLLGIYQNSNPRHWTKQEVQDMERVASQLWEVLQQADNLQKIKSSSEQLAQSAERERTIVKIVDRIRRSLDLNNLFNTTAREIRGQLKADRVGIFRFYPESGFDDGEFVSEDVNSNYSSAVKAKIHDHCFGTDYADKYENGRIQAVSDIYSAGLQECHIDVLSQFQVRANLIVPILRENKLWGLLCVHQCAEPREWQENEIEFVKQIAAQFGVALQQAEYLEQIQAKSKQLAESADRDRAVTKVVNRIRQTLDLETIFRITTQEVRSLLRCDRVAVFRFNPDWSGVFVSESVAPGWVSLVEKQYGIDRLQESIRDCDHVQALVQGKEKTLRTEMPNRQMLLDDVMKETQGGQTTRDGMFIRDDIYAANFDPCYVEVLEEYQAKAYAIVSIYRGDKLWGMLAAYQNSGPRHWEDVEINLLTQIASQLGVALQQAEYLQQIQAKSKQLAEAAERERTLTKVIDRIRKSFDLETIFRTTTQEVRQLIQTDRVAIYKFRPDYFGDFIAESEAPGEPKLVGLDRLTAWEDPYLNEEKGGRFQENKPLVVDDVYNAGLTDCHVEALEMFHVKACVVVAIFKGDQLWGLLSAFDNKEPRHWEKYEVELLRQVANQIGIAIQQTEYLKELQTQSIQLEASAQREKQAKEEIEMRAVQLLRAVRPALDGDLTVRAPVTEDVVGTIADAYNNTLQSLRKLVGQVQKAAQQVALTSNNSDAAIGGLTTSAQAQSQDITQALDKIEQMVASTNAVVENARLVEVAVQRANQTVETGDTAMNRTVDSIQVIRDTVAQTAKKIKSLSDSSQKISKAVNLIGNFATQTNVLALNAAIEATRAGEYGKGFAVVAEEVRSLSRQSAEATKEIEELVKEIQEGTGEVAATMEKGIQQVVEGTNLVNETRESLNEIVSSTTEISQLVESITQATQVQTQQSQLVTKVMTEVAQVANQTSGESMQMSASFKELLDMAQELLTTTGKFKVN